MGEHGAHAHAEGRPACHAEVGDEVALGLLVERPFVRQGQAATAVFLGDR